MLVFEVESGSLLPSQVHAPLASGNASRWLAYPAAEGSFDSTDFRARFNDEYNAAPCRFSMTGGILVELGMANLVPGLNEKTCRYTKKP
jgi:hypothetical protein